VLDGQRRSPCACSRASCSRRSWDLSTGWGRRAGLDNPRSQGCVCTTPAAEIESGKIEEIIAPQKWPPKVSAQKSRPGGNPPDFQFGPAPAAKCSSQTQLLSNLRPRSRRLTRRRPQGPRQCPLVGTSGVLAVRTASRRDAAIEDGNRPGTRRTLHYDPPPALRWVSCRMAPATAGTNV